MAKTVGEPIAIIGSACHFAGEASSPSKLWTLLQNPHDVRREVPNSRFSARGFYHKRHTQPGHSNVRHGYLMNEDLSGFDAEFFGIKPLEAKAIDPQQRWLMESVYEGLESAGLTLQALRGSDTGVYVGVMGGDYETMLLRDLQATPTYFATGTARSMLSNRISHFFDWRGPSITIDTACSSSLVAVHMAVQTLRAGDSRVAVACGSNLILGPENYIIESKLKMLSPDGISRMWDQDANGYARGDGVAAVVLKTLSTALADGDHIECIIRETGTNQDGATPGITVPSASAQEALIRNTYAKAGLDIGKLEDRPQYFEAHGTGTPAGDPIEAEAIQHAFFGCEDAAGVRSSGGDHFPLFVGSIKTVLGHTEGTAGLAGILKASLALQNGMIPPNLHFNHLADRVAPFYNNVEIVRGSARSWPVVDGINHPSFRRASVNSFGFGGTNAHAILESCCDHDAAPSSYEGPLFTPFVFSASTEASLRASLGEYSTFLSQRPLTNAHDLAWTLRQRRSVLAHRISYPAESIKDLQEQISKTLQSQNGPVGVRAKSHGTPDTILGVLTGQGAQFPRLGAELVERSATARDIIIRLEEHLTALPVEDRPSWSLMAELLAPSTSTRIAEAALSQPLCTAVQILLIDLLALAGVHFDAVVGHSSGEIAAAYAAGVLSARDAILIAYFRGVYVGRAMSPNGPSIRGGMLAVGTSMEDAEDLCNDDVYAGRLGIAACNSSSSVTISGDLDAIEELEELLEDEGKFHRRLRVDTAYHSRHMELCFAPYVEALRRCNVQVLRPSTSNGSTRCQWFSSVRDELVNLGEDIGLSDRYWAENMTRPVLFSQALKTAFLSTHGTGFGIALEVGPHPALRGPAEQTIQETLGKGIPYFSTLVRGTEAVKALSTSLGLLWQHLQPETTRVPDLDSYERAMIAEDIQDQNTENHRFKVIKGLPSYQWNHTTQYWAESRASRKMRLRDDVFHPLLGHATPDSSKHHLTWRNLLRREKDDGEEDFLQLDGHRVQGQTVFPAAGYIATAVEAARALTTVATGPAQESTMKTHLIEIHKLDIHQAVVLSSDKSDGVEILVEVADIYTSPKSDRIKGRFSYSAALGDKDELTLVASAEIEVLVGEDDLNPQLLPPRQPPMPHLVPVEKERFYESLASLGYEYEGAFRSLSDLKRKHGKASCMVQLNPTGPNSSFSHPDDEVDDDTALLLHPAGLDSAFQSLLLAYSYPGDHHLNKLHLPLSIECIRVNPALCGSFAQRLRSIGTDGLEQDNASHVDATIIRPTENGQTWPSLSSTKGGFRGDINVYTAGSPNAAVQVLNVHLVPLGGSATKEEYRNVFFETKWVDMVPDGLAAALADRSVAVTQKERDQLEGLKRLAVFYYRQFDAQVPKDSSLRSVSESGATAYFLQYAEHVLSSLPDDWPVDTPESINEVTAVCESLPDVGVMHLVGQTMPRVFRGETTMLEAFRESGVLDDYYVHSFSSAPSGRWQTRLVEQIASRHPHLKMLEIGAGTGGTTKPILSALGDRFQSYTFTDVSAGFFSTAATALASFQDRLTFKTLDIESDPRTQGFQEGAYDLIVASFVLHATASLTRTLANVRKLLRPGGFLVVGEGSVQTTPVSSFIFGPLPGWWLGRDDGRMLTPHASAETWDTALRANGFSGIDAKAPDEWEDVLGVCLFSSQAINDQVQFLRSPLSSSNPQPRPKTKGMVIVGGQTPRVAGFVAQISAALEPYAEQVSTYTSLATVDYDVLEASQSAVLSLVDLDKPVFKGMTEQDFVPFQRMFRTEKTLLWVTTGRRSEEPFSNMVVGFGRTAVHETPGLNLQHLDLESVQMDTENSSKIIAESFLRLVTQPVNAVAGDRSILWTVEPEIAVDMNGHHRAARLLPIHSLNDRYNSGRRLITQDVDLEKVPVRLQPEQSGAIALERIMHTDLANSSDSLLKLHLSHAIVPAIRTPLGPKFLVLGTERISGAAHLALITSLASPASIPKHVTMAFPSGSGSEAGTLFSLATHLIALCILEPVLPSQTVVVHNATSSIAENIHNQAISKGVETVFITDQSTWLSSKLKYLHLPRYLSQAELWKLLPPRARISSFVSLASSTSSRSQIDAMIRAGLEPWCRVETAETLFSLKGYGDQAIGHPLLGKLLQQALDHMRKDSNSPQSTPTVVGLEQLVHKKEQRSPSDVANGADETVDCTGSSLHVVDFTTSTRLPARITRLDAGHAMFKPDKTYWVVGLSGDLGISLCDWMISTVSRHLVLTSRKPNIEQSWIDSHQRNGVSIDILPCDITDYSALTAVHAGMRTTHPPIAGVLNGAMVLRDTSIRNMTFPQLDDVVRPKVTGSLNLDRIFSAAETPLDFFILFSSTNFTIGNQGQANYAAANAFQCALAASRRKRGLAGTAVNIGAIIGAGYIQRSTNYKRVLDLTITRGNMMHLSEEDFHQLIAEAIEAGRPRSDGFAELTTGLLSAEHDTTSPPIWFSDPKFTHLIVRRNGADNLRVNASSDGDLDTPAAVQERLKACQSPTEFENVITKAFAAQLRQELQITGREDAELMHMRSNEIGLDSLVSVDIRTWFLKAVGVSIPVLRIMGNDTMASLVQIAVESCTVEVDTETPPTSVTESNPPSSPRNPHKTEDNIDWEAETRPPTLSAVFAQQLQSAVGYTPSPNYPPKVIVLTGITGLLGSHLLTHVLKILPTDGKAICIGLRHLPTSHPDRRVIFHAGDFTLPCLGLSPSESTSILATADAVIHVGADTSHLKPYAALRQANVGSTAELARLCLPRGVPLHYVSTVGVGFFSGEAELRPGRAGGEPAPDGEGYTTSKWVCERMLERLSASAGLPVWIHRPSAVLRLGRDNEGARAQMDWLNGLLRYVTKLRAVPEVRHNKGALDMVYAKSVCDSILRCVFGRPNTRAAFAEAPGVTYVHQVGDIVIPLDHMEGILDLRLDLEEGQGEESCDKATTHIGAGPGCEVLAMAEWTARARAEGLHPAVLELVKSIDDPTKPEFPRLLKS